MDLFKKEFNENDIVTIVLLTYNHDEYINKCIKSIIDVKTFSNIPVLFYVFDDCSTDDTYNSILKHSIFIDKIVRRDKNLGFANNYKLALDEVFTKYYFLANHDDIYDRNLINFLITPFKIFPDIGVSFCANSENDNLKDNFFDFQLKPFYKGLDFTFSYITLNKNLACKIKATSLILTKAYYDAGGINLQYGLLTDVSLYLSILKKYNVGFINIPLISSMPKLKKINYPDAYSQFSLERQYILYKIHDDYFANVSSVRKKLKFTLILNKLILHDYVYYLFKCKNIQELKIKGKFIHELYVTYFLRNMIKTVK